MVNAPISPFMVERSNGGDCRTGKKSLNALLIPGAMHGLEHMNLIHSISVADDLHVAFLNRHTIP